MHKQTGPNFIILQSGLSWIQRSSDRIIFVFQTNLLLLWKAEHIVYLCMYINISCIR